MATHEQVLEFIREIIEEVKDFDGVVNDETTFEELALDSLDYVQTQIEAKKQFGIDLQPELFASGKIVNVGQLCAYIAQHTDSLEAEAVAAV